MHTRGKIERILMKMRTRFRPKIILVLLTVAIVMTALSTFFFTRLDQVVHGELYKFGLEFSYEWAGQYWTNSGDMVICLTITLSLTGASIVYFLFYVPTRLQKNDLTKLAICLILIAGIAATASSAYFFNRLDHVVNNDLYKYGLQFNSEWAVQYWTYAKLILTLIGLQIAVTAVSIVLISGDASVRETQRFISAHALSRVSSKKLISSTLFSAGLLALVFSINYASKILAFIGLGLVLWSIILFYTLSENHVKETLPDTTTLPSLTNLDKIIKELGYEGEAAYLPPIYCKDVESSKVYINAQEDQKLFLPAKIPEDDGGLKCSFH